ncbi:thiamine-phosphate pyrophosphorylase [Aquimixticola soesokkakensis]|uniref:Thiamine-phosphate pyrophosphorylase n=1 Tax=Aquimixticola soesokkakensis TaxID=1519096 RepID=A0A1Y5SJF5_9RHOB|nr:thiamine phosphate synthase [Aquimixticola soesokkakensis]SLN41018.1 thiamine-phosphate pyrophosphorylase [Aquimixticola soesokkakensis]
MATTSDTPEKETPQIYLVTPASFDLDSFPAALAAVLDANEVACLRLALASKDEDDVARAADALREICHARDVAIVIEAHVQLVERLGLDGVHLATGSRSVRNVRKELGADAIVGCYCAASRHDGMTAAEIGADYVSFGPVGESGLGDGTRAEDDLFQWWSDVIEVPVVAEGALTLADITRLTPITDFFAIGDEIWKSDSPAQALADIIATINAAMPTTA